MAWAARVVGMGERRCAPGLTYTASGVVELDLVTEHADRKREAGQKRKKSIIEDVVDQIDCIFWTRRQALFVKYFHFPSPSLNSRTMEIDNQDNSVNPFKHGVWLFLPLSRTIMHAAAQDKKNAPKQTISSKIHFPYGEFLSWLFFWRRSPCVAWGSFS